MLALRRALQRAEQRVAPRALHHRPLAPLPNPRPASRQPSRGHTVCRCSSAARSPRIPSQLKGTLARIRRSRIRHKLLPRLPHDKPPSQQQAMRLPILPSPHPMPAPHMQPKMAKALAAFVAQQPCRVLLEDAEEAEPVSFPQFHAGHTAGLAAREPETWLVASVVWLLQAFPPVRPESIQRECT